ncbi:putative xanthine dehydrogenase subunit A [bacterium HR17]|uniref:Putative xanthine dehydrogenase subunit A n=1 Tax=Candidatus Fervidibacter japonicus TaxID=2035412 RepID=A0A2H5X8V7_9BACT|nr:putative xanthine dehydrogenase subunit A [bacterium HR17]
MRKLFYQLVELLEQGVPFAFGEVVETHGSTPQKPGAKAIFLADGRSSGTLGGGCLEAESRRVALECLRERSRSLLTLHLNDDFGWDDGLICGGTAKVFLDGKPDEHDALWRAVADFLKSRRRGALLVIVNAAAPSLLGVRWLVEVNPDGKAEVVMASPPDAPSLPPEALGLAQQVVQQREEKTLRVPLQGATAELFAEPLLPRPHLIVVGAGHIGAAVAHLGALLEFEVTVIDDRPSFANRERLPEADHILVGDIPQTVAQQPIDQDTYIVIVTRGHRHDAQVLREVVKAVDTAAYIGMIGSRRKIKLIYDELLELGLATPEQLARIHAPLGIDIGGESVWEIAVSIAAELVWVRNGQAGTLRPLNERTRPLVLSETAGG